MDDKDVFSSIYVYRWIIRSFVSVCELCEIVLFTYKLWNYENSSPYFEVIAFVFCAMTIWRKTMFLLYIMLMITFFVVLMISKWNDVIYLIWIDVVVEKCHFSCFSILDFCSWWGYYKRFYGIVVSWKYVLVNIISYVSFFYVYIFIWCDVMVFCLCGNLCVCIYIYIYI